jgi:hypothetical protein
MKVMKVYLVRWAFLKKENDRETHIKIFEEEKGAWKFCLHNFGLDFRRTSPYKIDGLRGKWINSKRWVLITEHKLFRKVRRIK